jgi:hypothetical protein
MRWDPQHKEYRLIIPVAQISRNLISWTNTRLLPAETHDIKKITSVTAETLWKKLSPWISFDLKHIHAFLRHYTLLT